jgi:hypothetical protein
MNHKYSLLSLVIVLAFVLLSAFIGTTMAMAQEDEPLGPVAIHGDASTATQRSVLSTNVDTAFTYQGKLTDGGSLANGAYDFFFVLKDAPSAGNDVAFTLAHDVEVTEGLFTVELDFGEVFDGKALWLFILVRPGDSTGGYTLLNPPQALTAAPYALSLRPGAVISGTVPAGSGALNLQSVQDGLRVASAGNDGVHVTSADNNGVSVGVAGNPSMAIISGIKNGFEVAGAEGNGLNIGRADGHGIQVNSAGHDGVYVGTAGDDGVSVNSAGDDGVHVYQAGAPPTTRASIGHHGFEVEGAEDDGLHVGWAANDGVHVHHAGGNGVYVLEAGTPSSSNPPLTDHNGIAVAGAEGDGLYIGRANDDGVHVYWASNDGVYLDYVDDDGLQIDSAVDEGVYVVSAGDTGIYVQSADGDGVYANTTQASNEWGVYTPDKIYAGSTMASGGPLLFVAQNGDTSNLDMGDVVVVSGKGAPFGESPSPTPLVRRASVDQAMPVFGVVYSHFVLTEKSDEVEYDGQEKGHTSLHANSAAGPAAPGEYLLVVVMGAAQVKVNSLSSEVYPGALLAIDAEGQATIAGANTTFGSIIGTAIEASDAAEDGLIWVLVNPR